jgi:hypothetical protein
MKGRPPHAQISVRRPAARRSLWVQSFEGIHEVVARPPKPRDNPSKYLWLRLKPVPRLTPQRDE